MRDSLHPGKQLPESEEDFLTLRDSGRAAFLVCLDCKKPFSADNTTSPLGWAETQISGMCEDCFDFLFREIEDDDLPSLGDDE